VRHASVGAFTTAMRFPGFNVVDSRITQNLTFSAFASKPGQASSLSGAVPISQGSDRLNASE